MEFITHSKHAENISQTERTASVIAGGALLVTGLIKRNPLGWTLAALGGELIRRGATGHCYLYQTLGMRTADLGQGAETTSVPYELGVRVEKAVTVNKPREEVYRFWRNVENLPKFMEHLQCVKRIDDKRSHWVAKGPAGREVEWDAEIVNETENELIGWRSIEGSQVQNAGSVTFRTAPDGRGTEVRVLLQYNPPAGAVGAIAAKLFRQEPSGQIEHDLMCFKQMMEAGEVPTTVGQPSGRDVKRDRERSSPEVQYASEHSFPASDSPSWNR